MDTRRPHAATKKWLDRCCAWRSSTRWKARAHPYRRTCVLLIDICAKLLPLPPSYERFVEECSSPFMRLAEHLMALVQAMSAWVMKTRRAPSRHSRDTRVYSHTTTAMHKVSTPPPSPPLASLASPPPIFRFLPSVNDLPSVPILQR